MGILTYNPQKETPERLDRLTCGSDRLAILDQILRSLRADIGQPTHQHQLLIGPRGAGKTHLLRVLTAARLPADPDLRDAYLPIILPEETSLRAPTDLILRILERLSSAVQSDCEGLSAETRAAVRAVCLQVTTTAKGVRQPEQRFARAREGIARVADITGRILAPVVENLDSLLYLGASGKRTAKRSHHWALRQYMQHSPHILLIGSAVTKFGAIGDPEAPFYDFFRTHDLQELSNDEVLDIIERRLQEEQHRPVDDPLRRRRVAALTEAFPRTRPELAGLLGIAGGLPRYAHLLYDVLVETDVGRIREVFDEFVNELTPYFQQRLDPRLLPEAELDLLRELASATGPLTPSELADRLYGARLNEVAQLLDRLQRRGLVRRRSPAGGRAVFWDVAEPMYRVWTRFRAGETEQYLLLAEFVAILYSQRNIEHEQAALQRRLSQFEETAPASAPLRARLKFLGLVAKRREDRESGRFSVREAPAEPALPSVRETGTQATAASPFLDAADVPFPEIRTAVHLFNALNDASANHDLPRRDALLDELRALGLEHPDEPAVQELLAKGLVNTIFDAKEEDDLRRRDGLLDDLRTLAAEHPDEHGMREALARALSKTIIDAKEENNLPRRDALLDELRALAAEHPDEPAVREAQAKALVNMIVYAKDEDDLPRWDALLEELRTLATDHPDEPAVREWLARALFNTMFDAREEDDLPRRDALLDELRALAQRAPRTAPPLLILADALEQNRDVTNEEEVEATLEAGESLLGHGVADHDWWRAQAALTRARLARSRRDLDAALGRLTQALTGWLLVGETERIGLVLLELEKLVESEWDEARAGRAIALVGEAVGLPAALKRAALLSIGAAVLREHGPDALGSILAKMEAFVHQETPDFLHPLRLGLEALRKGEEKVLAREPEEMRRVVRMLLENVRGSEQEADTPSENQEE